MSKAQTDFRFADTTAVWNVKGAQYIEVFGPPGGIDSSLSTIIFRVQKDTFINNYHYQKITQDNLYTAGFIRKDSSGKVFAFIGAPRMEEIIYDFGLEAGDTFNTQRGNGLYPDSFMMVVDSMDIVVYGSPKKRMFVRCITSDNCGWSTEDVWIEGIGSLNSHLAAPNRYSAVGAIPGESYKVSCYHENNITYNFSASCFVGINEKTASTDFILSPNPASTYLNIALTNSPQRLQSVELYSLAGKRLIEMNPQGQSVSLDTQYLPPGVYFCRMMLENGDMAVRKVVIE